jgi:hypothetical protein
MTNYLLPFQRQKSNQPWFERLQDYLDRFFAIICKNPFIKGQLLQEQTLRGADGTALALWTQIPHSLGKIPIGVIVLASSADEELNIPPGKSVSSRVWSSTYFWVYCQDGRTDRVATFWVF